ncbi:MAG TPA: DUF58 domain-containing protein [Desulfuromonadales bacterium]|nr:DUF58 domain-containing protein [Desulfuromonadales bacterium]
MKLTRAGVLYIVITLVLGFAAVNTGNNLLYLVVSALLGFMVISGIIGKANIEKIDLRLDLPDEIYAGRQTFLGLRVINRKRWLPAFLLDVRLHGGKALLTGVDRRGGSRRARLPFSFPTHGRKALEGVEIRSIFPINFFVRSRFLTVEQEALVFPTPFPCPEPSGVQGRSSGRGRQTSSAGGEGDISRIAEYSGREPMKLIHWKLTARHDELKVKQLSEMSREPVVLNLEQMPGETTEARLQCACYQINRYFRQERPVGLQLKGRHVPPATGRNHKLKLLAELALYDQD